MVFVTPGEGRMSSTVPLAGEGNTVVVELEVVDWTDVVVEVELVEELDEVEVVEEVVVENWIPLPNVTLSELPDIRYPELALGRYVTLDMITFWTE